MNSKRPLLAMACSALFLTGSCDDHVIGHGQPIVLNCRREPPLTYENFGEGILGRHCTSCHSVYVRQNQRADAPLGVDFDTWDDVLTWAERIKVRSVDMDDMPPAGGMVADERIELEEWLRCEVLPAKGQFLPEDTGALEAVP